MYLVKFLWLPIIIFFYLTDKNIVFGYTAVSMMLLCLIHHIIHDIIVSQDTRFLIKEYKYYKIVKLNKNLKYANYMDFNQNLRAVCFIKQPLNSSYFELYEKVKCPYGHDNCSESWKLIDWCMHLNDIEDRLKDLKIRKLIAFS